MCLFLVEGLKSLLEELTTSDIDMEQHGALIGGDQAGGLQEKPAPFRR